MVLIIFILVVFDLIKYCHSQNFCGFSQNNRVSDCTRFLNIYGGTFSTPHTWPWMVNIMLKTGETIYEPFCGGSIVSNRVIISAAHCVNYRNASTNFKVAVGMHNLGQVVHKELLEIEHVIVHPNYDPVSADSDISIIILKKPLKYGLRIKPICLPASTINVDHKGCYSTGWGSTADGHKSSILRQVCLPVIPWNTCKGLYNRHFTTNMLCAGDIQNGVIDTCDGDSGGPLACQIGNRWTLYGIISWGFGCGIPKNPGIFTNVQNYIGWINQHLII